MLLALACSARVKQSGEQLHSRSAVKPSGDGVEGGFAASPNPVDTLLRRRAWSKLAERIDGDGHEESNLARYGLPSREA